MADLGEVGHVDGQLQAVCVVVGGGGGRVVGVVVIIVVVVVGCIGGERARDFVGGH